MRLAPELTGLSSEEVQKQIELGLDNQQNFEKSRSLFAIFRSNFLTLFNAVVGGAFLVLLILGYWKDALFGLAVIANVIIGVVQEYRSKLILERLAILNQNPVKVRREGVSREIPIQQIVLGDLLELQLGDQLPADAKVLASQNLELDESLLTGEAEPVSKIPGEQLLSGSAVISGSALVEVNRVGASTYTSQLLGEARRFSQVSSEIRRSLNKIIRWLSWILGPIMLIVIFGQLQTGGTWNDAIVRSIASIISMVPQGLVLITSIAFAIAATKLAKLKVLVQELAAVEGLARVDVVCLDKTGTLTLGSIEYDSVIELVPAKSEPLETARMWPAVLGEFAHQISANATARALRSQFPKTSLAVSAEIEFDSLQKWSAIETAGNIWYLGAPEVLTADTEVLNLTSTEAKQGFRTLLLAVGSEPKIPVVLIKFREMIHPEARATVDYLTSEGVQLMVLSGDHPETVSGIAKAAGLNFQGAAVDAKDFLGNTAALRNAIDEQFVFGRVTPEQKKQIIEALQDRGHVVAMIGDGVNDVLALKQADLGIAMGSGAAATKGVADLVLIDNRFASMPEIVGEGRRVIANVERLSRLFLTKTSWALILAIVFGLTLWEFPFLPRQLSAIDGFTIGIPAFLLALLPNKQPYRPGFLRRSLMFCIPAGLITAIAVISLAFLIRLDGTWQQSEAQTATATLLSITGLWVLGSLARPWSKIKLGIVLLMVLTALGMFLLPLTVEYFGFAYLSPREITLTLGIGLMASVAIEITNRIANRKNRK